LGVYKILGEENDAGSLPQGQVVDWGAPGLILTMLSWIVLLKRIIL